MSASLLVTSNFGAVAVHAVLYGVFCALFFWSNALIIIKSRRKPAHALSIARRPLLLTPPFIASIGIFLFVTSHWILMVYRSFKAFALKGGPNSLVVYATLSDGSYIAQVASMAGALTISDGMMVYRTWAIWGCRYSVIALPLLAFPSAAICFLMLMWKMTLFRTAQDIVSLGDVLTPWILSSVGATLFANAYCSGLIGWKLWRTSRRFRRIPHGGSVISRYLAMLIEMAAFYVAITLLYFATYMAGSKLEFFFQYAMAPVAGIAFMLINVRVGLGYSLSSRALSFPGKP